MSSRIAYCTVNAAPLRKDRDDTSEMVSQLLFGELVEVEEVIAPWAKVTGLSDHYSGFTDQKQLRFISEKEMIRWMDARVVSGYTLLKVQAPEGPKLITRGAFTGPDEVFNIGRYEYRVLEKTGANTFTDPCDFAASFIGTPYLWGGKNAFGIDCSALMQVVLRMFDINLPRDAWQQAETGMAVEWNDLQRNDLAFFINTGGKIIHVGICDGEGGIIHASGEVRRDQLTVEGIFNREADRLTHHLHSVCRI